MESGKSTQIAIGRVLWELGKNPDLRVKIVCSADDLANQRVFTVLKYIEFSKRFRKVFPNCRPSAKKDWTKSKFSLEREVSVIDPSLEGSGVLTGVGGRADLIIFDDVVDYRNAIANPSLKKTVIDAFFSVWMTRLEPGGRAVLIGTRWAEDDLYSVLLESSEWSFLEQSISDDFKYVESKRIN